MPKPTDIAQLRLLAQHVTSPHFKTPEEVVRHMGAMQAQDYAMARWGIGIRLPGAPHAVVEDALNKGQVLRTHVMRPTWHLVAADDIYWMLELTAPQIHKAARARHKELELSDAVLVKTNSIIAKALAGKKHLTREALVEQLVKHAKLKTDNNRMAYILMHAELDGLICSGKLENNKHTYALLEERVKKKKPIPREEALAALAQRFFESHGPATVQDFTWWSGLGPKDAREGLEAVKEKLVSEKINDDTYWLSASLELPKTLTPSVYLLPAYDEFIISYKNRSASLMEEHIKRTISTNGIFFPTVVVNGQVKGLWKRTVIKDKVLIETELFAPLDKKNTMLLKKEAARFGEFLEKEADLVVK